jgi:hypothetical protein
MAMHKVSSPNRLFPKATAGCNFSAFQMGIQNLFLVAAIAKAKAVGKRLSAGHSSGWRVCDYGKSCESATDQGYFNRHNVMALCSAAASGYRPDVCRDSFVLDFQEGVNT